MTQYQPTLVDQGGSYLDAYRNPPFYALIYVPTSRLPYLVSFWIWTAISLALLWFGLGLAQAGKALRLLRYGDELLPGLRRLQFRPE